MQNRTHHRSQAIELYELAAAAMENNDPAKAHAFEHQGNIAFDKAHTGEIPAVDHYIKALHHCRMGFIHNIQASIEEAHGRFKRARRHFKHLSPDDMTHDMYFYFAQACYVDSIIYLQCDKNYSKAIESANAAIDIMKQIPSREQFPDDELYILSYQSNVIAAQNALDPANTFNRAEELARQVDDIIGCTVLRFNVQNKVCCKEAIIKAGQMLRAIPDISIQSRASLLQTHSLFAQPNEDWEAIQITDAEKSVFQFKAEKTPRNALLRL